MVEQPCEYTENHWILPLKVVDFMVCKLYLNKKKREKFIFSSLAQLYSNILVTNPLYILNNYCRPPRAFVYGFCFQFLCVYVKYPLTFTIKTEKFLNICEFI